MKKNEIIGSEVLFFELENIPEILKREEVSSLLPNFEKVVLLNDEIVERAKEIHKLGFKNFDSLHLACAESEGVVYFLTTDDGIVKKYRKNSDKIKLICMNPLEWIRERM